MPQNTTDWMPSLKQAKVLEAAQDAGLNRSIVAICEAAGVDRTSWYRWMKRDEKFRLAWREIWYGTLERHLPGVIAAVIAKALEGDIPAARLIADLAGVLKQKVEHSTPPGQPIAINQEGHSRLDDYLETIALIALRTTPTEAKENEIGEPT